MIFSDLKGSPKRSVANPAMTVDESCEVWLSMVALVPIQRSSAWGPVRCLTRLTRHATSAPLCPV